MEEEHTIKETIIEEDFKKKRLFLLFLGLALVLFLIVSIINKDDVSMMISLVNLLLGMVIFYLVRKHKNKRLDLAQEEAQKQEPPKRKKRKN